MVLSSHSAEAWSCATAGMPPLKTKVQTVKMFGKPNGYKIQILWLLFQISRDRTNRPFATVPSLWRRGRCHPHSRNAKIQGHFKNFVANQSNVRLSSQATALISMYFYVNACIPVSELIEQSLRFTPLYSVPC